LPAVTLLAIVSDCNPAAADLWAISTDEFYSRVIRFDNDGNELSGGIPTGLGGLVAPSGITVDANGRIYVSSRGNESNTPKILIYSCDDLGSCATDTLSGGTPGVFAEFSGAQPAQLRIGPDGNLHAAELFGQNVRVYDTGDGTRLTDAAANLAGAGGLAFETDGDLLVGTVAVPDFEIPSTISRFSGGSPQAPFFVSTLGETVFPASLLFLPNGDLLAVDLFTDQIVRFDSAGNHLGTFASIPSIISGMPSFPSDIVFDPDGNLIVAVLGPTNPGDPAGNQGQLLRYDLDGNLLEVIADELEQVGGLAWTADPKTLAGDYDGNGLVESADYLEWKADYGKWVAPGNGSDGNGDGIVDAADYTVWRNNLPAEIVAAGASVVPEPSAGALLVILLCVGGLARRLH
jgi:sugar lactone lactonase YvrE